MSSTNRTRSIARRPRLCAFSVTFTRPYRYSPRTWESAITRPRLFVAVDQSTAWTNRPPSLRAHFKPLLMTFTSINSLRSHWPFFLRPTPVNRFLNAPVAVAAAVKTYPLLSFPCHRYYSSVQEMYLKSQLIILFLQFLSLIFQCVRALSYTRQISLF